MTLSKKVSWTLAGLLVLAMLVMFSQRAEASDNEKPEPPGYGNRGNNDCNGRGNCNDTEIGGAGGAGGEGGGGGSAVSDSVSGVGDITITETTEIPANTTHKARIENTPDIVTITPGSGDSCKAHIGFGVAVPGLGTSLNIPLPGKECRKLKAYDRLMAADQFQAAEIIFCSLKEVRSEFKSVALDCIEILTLFIVPGPEPVGVTMTFAEYDDLLAQAASSEDLEEYAEQSEYRYTQQQHLIEALEEEHADDDQEIKALKKRVNDEVAEADARRAAVREKIAAKEAEADGSENPDK